MSEFTDTDRIEFLASLSERMQGLKPGEFRAQLDAQILANRASKVPVQTWLDLTVEFPVDDVPVRVLCADGQTGRASYCSEAGDWYVFCPGTDIHGRLWKEVFGRESDIVCWQPVEDNHQPTH